jgi:hypothetical protein
MGVAGPSKQAHNRADGQYISVFYGTHPSPPLTAMGHTLSNHFERSRLEMGEAQVDVTCLVSQCLVLPAHSSASQATYYTCLHIEDDIDGYYLQLKLQRDVLLQSY